MFGHFWCLCLSLSASPIQIFFHSKFFGFVTRTWVFRALDWLASTLGDKIMAQEPSFWQKFEIFKKVTLATCGWQPDWARELFKPSKTHEVYYIKFKKNFQDFFGLWSHEWRMFCEYSYDVICGSNLRIMWLKVLLDPGVEYKFLEPLIDFLAFLIPKLGQKEPNPLLIISGDFHN